MLNQLIFRRPKAKPQQQLTPRALPNPPPVLPIVKTDCTFRVRQSDLEQLITKVFGFEFDLLVATAQVAGMLLTYKIDGVHSTQAYRDRAHLLQCGKRTRDVFLILQTLCELKVIAPGTYVIE